METDNMQMEQSTNEEMSFAEIFFHYLSYWKWFVISVIVCLLIAFIYLRYTTREYNVSSKVLIKDDQKGGQTPFDVNAFSDLGLVSRVGKFDNELEVLLSKTLMKEVSDSLKIGVSYYKEGRIKKEELYNTTPIFVTVSDQIGIGSFEVKKMDDNTFTLTADSEDFTQKFNINEEVHSPWGVLQFKENPFGIKDFPIEVTINHPKKLPLVEITPVNKQTTVVDISTVTAVPQKGIDVINTLVKLYNQKAVAEKNYVATNTIHFINDRLSIISGELESAEKDVEIYKRSRGLTDIQAEAGLFLNVQSEYTKQISEKEVQLSILRSIKDFIVSPDNSGNIAPANVGLTDPTVLTLIQKYNEEIFAKNKTTIGMTANNPVLKEFDERIALLKENLVKGINIAEDGMKTTLTELNKQENTYLSKALGLSTQERESRELYRQKEIKESLFIYLLQKSEETGLSLALATPNAIVIDAADYNPIPVKPKNKIILLAALLLGLIIPIAIIYVKDLFDNKLRNREQLKKMVKAPFLGDLPQAKSTKPFPVLNVRSGIAERFRIVSSNLGFIVAGDKSKVIMITSSYSGEGKSFFSQNLAMSLATLGKKTLLIDLDIRKSMLNKSLEMNPSKGIAMYLADPSISVSEIIDRSGNFHKNLDIIPIKVFPPNPAELLASERLNLLFEIVRNEYDYVIVDTAPVGLVADAFRINQFADATIYVTRADYTFKSALTEIQLLYKDNKLHNLTTVLNAVSHNSGYGYNNYGRYGYGGYGGYGNKKYYIEEN